MCIVSHRSFYRCRKRCNNIFIWLHINKNAPKKHTRLFILGEGLLFLFSVWLVLYGAILLLVFANVNGRCRFMLSTFSPIESYTLVLLGVLSRLPYMRFKFFCVHFLVFGQFSFHTRKNSLFLQAVFIQNFYPFGLLFFCWCVTVNGYSLFCHHFVRHCRLSSITCEFHCCCRCWFYCFGRLIYFVIVCASLL